MNRTAVSGLTVAFTSIALLVSATHTRAAESGVGFYLLGSRGPAAGVVPPPGTYLQNDLYFYSGSAEASLNIPTGGQIVAGLEADAVVNLVSLLWSTPTEFLGGNLAYSVTLPIGYQDVEASLSPGPLSVSRNVFTFGDPVIGAQVGWHSGNLHYTAATLINVPIGDYDENSIANVSFNRWGADLTFAVSYIDPDTGWDFSAAVGTTFNGENKDTNYKTGDEFHFEWAVSKSLSPAFSVGVIGYHYKQLTGDSGSGAVLGSFKGEVTAVGLTAAYNFSIAQRPVSLRAKYLNEFDARNRLEGDALFLTLALPF